MQTADEIERDGLSWATINEVWPHIVEYLNCPFCGSNPEPHSCGRSDMIIRHYIRKQ